MENTHIQKSTVAKETLVSSILLTCISTILVVVVLVGCQKRNQGKAVAEAPPPTEISKPPQKISGITEFKSSIIAGTLVNQYSVRLSWKTEGETRVSINRIQKTNGKNVNMAPFLQENLNEIQDNLIEPGMEYEYFIEQVSTGQTKSQRIIIPRDFEIQGEVRNPSLAGFRRLFLQKGAKINTEGLSLKIEVEELISDEATILSFPRNDSNASPTGRSGGRIEIVAPSARGMLRIIGNGENGRTGWSGNYGVPGKAGIKGQSGKWGMNPELYAPQANISHNFLESVRLFMERENFPPESPRWKDMLANIREFVCAVTPTDGTVGENGSDGGNGATGGRGGDSAEIFIKIKDDADLNIYYEAEPGLGGLGGHGGLAGKGGLGGDGGDLDRGHLCTPAKQGPSGLSGKDGLQGRVGENGTRKSVCISTMNRKEGDCHAK